jgi:hypothetical protein
MHGQQNTAFNGILPQAFAQNTHTHTNVKLRSPEYDPGI